MVLIKQRAVADRSNSLFLEINALSLYQQVTQILLQAETISINVIF